MPDYEIHERVSQLSDDELLNELKIHGADSTPWINQVRSEALRRLFTMLTRLIR